MRRMIVAIFIFGVVLSASFVVMAEDFYVIPVKGQFTSWDKKILGSTRFQLRLDNEAVLDKETGLVWERSPSTTKTSWLLACNSCYKLEVGGRKGWRPATVEELASLIDTTNQNPALPTGHPFNNIQPLPNDYYWSSTTDIDLSGSAWVINFGAGTLHGNSKGNNNLIWCVRGGHGYDAY